MKNNDKFKIDEFVCFGMPKGKIPLCPHCQTMMQRLYLRVNDSETQKRSYVGAGWLCPNMICNHFMREL